jgi:chaperonin GroEL (HSP60 family)
VPKDISFVSSKNFEHISGKEAWHQNLLMADRILSSVSSCFGPKGMYKLISYNKGPEHVIKVTKDAVAIVDEFNIETPAMQVYKEAVRMQRHEVGDGVNEFVILCLELVKTAYELIEKGVHPLTVIDGYGIAHDICLDVIERNSVESPITLQEAILSLNCGRNSLNSNLCQSLAESYRGLWQSGKLDEDRLVTATEYGGNSASTYVINGFVLKSASLFRKEPSIIHEPKIALVDSHFGVEHLEVKKPGEGRFPFRLVIDRPEKVSMFKDEIHRINLEYVRALKSKGANVLLCRQLISPDVESVLSSEGIFFVKSIEKRTFDSLAKAVGGTIVNDLELISEAKLGTCRLIEVRRIEPEDAVIFHGCDAISVILKGSTEQSLRELETLIKSSLKIARHYSEDPKFVPGASSTEMEMALELKRRSLAFGDKRQLAILAFSSAIEHVIMTLARNCGLDPINYLNDLRSLHSEGNVYAGISTSGVIDVREGRIWDLRRVKRSVIRRAYEVARFLIRIDHISLSKEIAKFHKE